MWLYWVIGILILKIIYIIGILKYYIIKKFNSYVHHANNI